MGGHVRGFEQWLLGRGYTPGSVRNMLKVVGQLGRWMTSVDLDVAGLNARSIEAFVSSCQEQGARRVPGTRSLAPLLDYLRGECVLVDERPPPTPVEELIGDYRHWLVADRGLAAPTVLRYENLARRFLGERAAHDGDRFVEVLAGDHVVDFLLRECSRVSVGAAKGRVAELRSLLRFLYVTGLTATPLASGVPPVGGWRDTALPRGIAATDVERLLDSCDRSDPGGHRDLAILTVVARLGLRSAEVARLELGDLDWRAGEIVVRGKARRVDRLPMPHDVGESLAAYLSEARPPSAIRSVFLALKAPMRAIRPDLVSDVTRRACDRAGLPRVGAHRLRHALATEMMQRGATLVAVSQVLRHRDLATTAIYAKVDLGALRGVAQPWPAVTR
ncbi:MAG: tyrosine-type recombinase/integrase [Acidimicrobiales bacterium]